ncbi:uncharacterized protein LOC136081217 [Hydra vulgaris]|uniref:Uncharacterized protein LOC136081217 n=1 Tax=Hydra vulgaris TaxID=6087 RepID=A0ABM4BZA5_HYDVU
MTTSEVLNFTEMPIVDNGIERFEFPEYEPAARTNLNNTREIRINIEQQDLFTLPSEAYLLFEGQLVKADGTAYANTDAVTLTNNGRATTMLGMLKYLNDFQLAQGLNQLWYKDNSTTAVLGDNPGDGDDDAIFKLASVALGKVNLNKVSLFIPHVISSDVEKISLYKSIESKVTLPVSFRARQCDTVPVSLANSFFLRLSVKTSSERPRDIIVPFQTNNDGDQNANASIFDHCDLKNIYIMLNQERYPSVNDNLSFPNQQFSSAYRDAAGFNEKFYGMNELITRSNITPSDYKDLYPLFIFDVSK